MDKKKISKKANKLYYLKKKAEKDGDFSKYKMELKKTNLRKFMRLYPNEVETEKGEDKNKEKYEDEDEEESDEEEEEEIRPKKRKIKKIIYYNTESEDEDKNDKDENKNETDKNENIVIRLQKQILKKQMEDEAKLLELLNQENMKVYQAKNDVEKNIYMTADALSKLDEIVNAKFGVFFNKLDETFSLMKNYLTENDLEDSRNDNSIFREHHNDNITAKINKIQTILSNEPDKPLIIGTPRPQKKMSLSEEMGFKPKYY